MDTNEFESDLQIDVNQLDVEAALQAERFFKWAEKSVEAHKDVDALKMKLDLTYSRLSGSARIDPEAFGLEKITEAAVDGAVKSHPEYIDALSEYNEARREASIIDKGVVAMEQRKRMIEILVTLHGQEYFAGPSAPRNLGEAYQKEVQRHSNAILDKQKSKLRKKGEVNDGTTKKAPKSLKRRSSKTSG